MRGSSSRENDVAPAAASARMPSAFALGDRNPAVTQPRRSRPAWSGVGGDTCSRTSTAAQSGSAATVAPAAVKASSVTCAYRPAPDSTTTSRPALASLATLSGTAATRRSPWRVSAGTRTLTAGTVPNGPGHPWEGLPDCAAMGPLQGAAVLAAGFVAGGMNAVVGAGTLVSFPALLAVGLDPVVANVSNSLGVLPGSLAGAYAYRHQLHPLRAFLRRAVVPVAAGSAAGALLLLL